MPRGFNPVPQYLDDAGDPLVAGKMFYQKSGTDIDLDTFADVNETVLNTNPVILTGSGRLPNVFFSGAAKQILEDADGVQIFERDPVTASGAASGGFAPAWDALTIYDIRDTVTEVGILYISITAANQNNNPAVSPANWTEFDLLKRWNTDETYELGDPVVISNRFYTSLTASNSGNDPTTDLVNWEGTGLKKPTVQEFLVAGATTWTKPAGCVTIKVEMQAGGGGGGSSGVTAGATGGGGGGGGAADLYIDVRAIASESITVGATGAGGVAGAGVAGGDTIFGAHNTSTGGGGGPRGTAGSVAGGAAGVAGAGADIGYIAEGGEAGGQVFPLGARGGGSHFGYAGKGRLGGGFSGQGKGGGGSAGRENGGGELSGANGSVGAIYVTQYFN